MISMKVLSTAAVMALVLPMATPTASFAGPPPGWGGGGGVKIGGGGVRMGGGPPAMRFSGGGGPVWHGGGGGGVWHGGGYRRGGGFIPGAVAGVVIGSAIASQSYGYYPGYYYGPGYYDNQYYDDGAVAVIPGPVGDDAIAYCTQTYRSYDLRSGTYLGYDGYRHPCP
jgi:hypothetical protein